MPGAVVAGATDFAIARSALELMATVSSSRSLVRLTSPPPPVTPVLTTVSGALSSTFTSTVTAGNAAPTASGSLRSQCSELAAAVDAAGPAVARRARRRRDRPGACRRGRPAGRRRGRRVAAIRVNVPCWPRTNVPVCDLSIVTSGTPLTITAAGALATDV